MPSPPTQPDGQKKASKPTPSRSRSRSRSTSATIRSIRSINLNLPPSINQSTQFQLGLTTLSVVTNAFTKTTQVKAPTFVFHNCSVNIYNNSVLFLCFIHLNISQSASCGPNISTMFFFGFPSSKL